MKGNPCTYIVFTTKNQMNRCWKGRKVNIVKSVFFNNLIS